MLAIITNLSPTEIMVVMIAAILIFGRRLPEVAAKGAVQLQKLRRGVNDFKRESGFDEEIRKARRLVDNPLKEVTKELTKEPASWRPPSPRVAPHPEAMQGDQEIGAELVNTPVKVLPSKDAPTVMDGEPPTDERDGADEQGSKAD
jgi:Sec-independent protein translocase protein TatA